MTDAVSGRRSKPSIDDQIAAIRQLIDAETTRLEFKVSRGLMRADTAQRRLDVLGAAFGTLTFVRRYGASIRTCIEAERAFAKERAAEIEALQSGYEAEREAA
ncbi:hypothetical protein [Pleomorphomonas sp. PLEO]|uniref:hypothetical protein n=1 Tax=Pleomorphomonas sp. PLEO TaxID=3239306 RepID=UPI00351E5E61